MWLKENVTRFVGVLDGWACGAGFGVFSFLGCFGFAGGVVVPWSILLYPRLYFLSCGINAFVFLFLLSVLFLSRVWWVCSLAGSLLCCSLFLCFIWDRINDICLCFCFCFLFLFLFRVMDAASVSVSVSVVWVSVLLLSAVFVRGFCFACFFWPSFWSFFFGNYWSVGVLSLLRTDMPIVVAETSSDKMAVITLRNTREHFSENFSEKSFRALSSTWVLSGEPIDIYGL